MKKTTAKPAYKKLLQSSEQVQHLYKLLKEQLMKIAPGRVVEHHTIPYISFRIDGQNFVEVHFYTRKQGIGLHLYKDGYNDPQNRISNVAPPSHKWTLSTRVSLTEDNIDDVIKLVLQSCRKVCENKKGICPALPQ